LKKAINQGCDAVRAWASTLTVAPHICIHAGSREGIDELERGSSVTLNQ
jgi:hypothetical protein